MKDALVYSQWCCDTNAFGERVSHTLAVIEQFFPEATYWSAGHNDLPRAKGAFVVDADADLERYERSIQRMWEANVANISRHDVPLERIVAEGCVFSSRIDLAVHLFINSTEMDIEVEADDVARVMQVHRDHFLDVLRAMGSDEAIAGGVWLRNHSAFAGDPIYLYEPRKPFASMYDVLKWYNVADEVRRIRASIRDRIGFGPLVAALEDLGLDPVQISNGRICVELGDALGKGGAATLLGYQKKVKALLR